MSNPGFEHGLRGWRRGTFRTTLALTHSLAHAGSCSVELGRTRGSGEAALDDSPESVASTVAGATYVASAWVRAPAGRLVILRVRETRRGSVIRSRVATMVGNGSWRQLVVRSARTSGRTSLGIEVLVLLARHGRAYVDDVSLVRQ